MDELCGSLTTYEMRTTSETSSRKEAAFNSTKKGKEEVTHKRSSEDSNAEVENFVINLKRGFGKYKGKLPLKYFNYGKVGHFATKCPYNETGEDEKRSFGRSTGKNKERNIHQQGRRG